MAEEKEKLITLDESKLQAFVAAYNPLIVNTDADALQHVILADDCWLRNFFACWYTPGGIDLLPFYTERLTQEGYVRRPDFTGTPVFHLVPVTIPTRQSLPLFSEEEQLEALEEIIGSVGEDVGVPMVEGETHHTAEAWPQSLSILDEDSEQPE